MSTVKLCIVLGSLNALLAVGLGAFGAHGLKSNVTAAMLEVYRTGVEYHFYHALGLLLIGALGRGAPESAWLQAAGALMLAGIVLFSGSLYGLSLTGVRWLGIVTPVGGVAFLASWCCCLVWALRSL
jgi:uncharacterized membrane protein YgdD (TMEM256/DUF423 family)